MYRRTCAYTPGLCPPIRRLIRSLGRTEASAYVEENIGTSASIRRNWCSSTPGPHVVAVRFRLRWHHPDGVVQEQMAGKCLQLTADGQISQVGIPIQDEHLRILLERSS